METTFTNDITSRNGRVTTKAINLLRRFTHVPRKIMHTDGEAAQSSQQPGTATRCEATVDAEPYNGSYECFIRNHSVRPQLKHAIAAAGITGGNGVVDDGSFVLKCRGARGKRTTRRVAAPSCARCAQHVARKPCNSEGRGACRRVAWLQGRLCWLPTAMIKWTEARTTRP